MTKLPSIAISLVLLPVLSCSAVGDLRGLPQGISVPARQAIRAGRYTLILHSDDDSTELYDLTADLGETVDLAADQPVRVAGLKSRLKVWLADIGANMPRALERK